MDYDFGRGGRRLDLERFRLRQPVRERAVPRFPRFPRFRFRFRLGLWTTIGTHHSGRTHPDATYYNFNNTVTTVHW